MNERDVFINYPFSDDYLDHFRAIVFTVTRSGFSPRCAQESDNAGAVRYDKICAIIRDSAYGIHDISKTELDPASNLPRFNMPFELGLFLGAIKFGPRSINRKSVLVLDREKYRYQQFLSDISGQDIHCHQGKVDVLIGEVATWLRDHTGSRDVPGGVEIAAEFRDFTAAIPALCDGLKLRLEEITFKDYRAMASEWIKGTKTSASATC